MTTWLTQITPDPRSRQVRRDLRDAVQMHKTVMSLVAWAGLDDQARAAGGVLYRIEETATAPRILVQTQVKPDPEQLPDGYGTARTRELDALLHWLHPGALVRYRLAASTVRSKARTREIIPLRGAAADDWWTARAPAAGLALQSLASRSPGDPVGRKTDDNENGTARTHRIRHTLTQFDGTATVTDPGALATAITAGIGRGKSYGCGLLSIAPLTAPS